MERYFDVLKIKSYDVIGSYKNPKRKFYGDIDLEEKLGKISPRDFVDKMRDKILKIKKTDGIYFIDFKAGNFNGKPLKWSENELIDGYRYIDDTRRIDLASAVTDNSIIKLDVLVLEKDYMMPISINYYFNKIRPNKNKFKGDIYFYGVELKKKGDLIGYVKKMKMYYTLVGDKEGEEEMTKILNSKLGLVYKYIGFLENLYLLLNSDNEGYNIADIRNILKKIYNELPLKVRHLMIPLTHTLTEHSMLITIPKVIKSLEEYIRKNIEL